MVINGLRLVILLICTFLEQLKQMKVVCITNCMILENGQIHIHGSTEDDQAASKQANVMIEEDQKNRRKRNRNFQRNVGRYANH